MQKWTKIFVSPEGWVVCASTLREESIHLYLFAKDTGLADLELWESWSRADLVDCVLRGWFSCFFEGFGFVETRTLRKAKVMVKGYRHIPKGDKLRERLDRIRV